MIERLTKNKMSDETTAVVEVAAESVENPAVSHEEYLELVAMRQSVLELKAQKADILEFVNVAQQYAQQLQGAQERLNLLNEALNENTTALQDRMKEIIAPHNVQGEFTISDSEPHTIMPPA
jgi:DNA anti-recombination protein RmuC